jgi:hypothetical protein
MKEELGAVVEAVCRAQAELAAYLHSADRDAELTIARLVGILNRHEVVVAAQLLQPGANPIPPPAVAQGAGIGGIELARAS